MPTPDPLANPWRSVTVPPPLLSREVHIWRILAPESNEQIAPGLAFLTNNEQARAARIRQLQSRHEFIAGRAALRLLLATHLNIHSSQVPVEAGVHGKPILASSDIAFNTAHSKGTVLLALARATALGIDIESLDRNAACMEIAERTFTPAEFAALSAITEPTRRRQAFFYLWTRKEAVAKADGRGLGLSMNAFTVPSGPIRDAPIHIPAVGSSTTKLFYLSNIPLEPPFAAALAVDSPALQIKLLTFPLWFFQSQIRGL